MNIPMLISRQIQPLLTINNNILRRWPPQKEKVVVVVGATGAGKSRLSIDLANRFQGAEIINSDKIQVYRGLDITTNKITDEECQGVPHHLLGVIHPDNDFSAADFRIAASLSIKSIISRRKLPIIVGGSNSFIDSLVDHKFCSNYECCFLWVNVDMEMLNSFVSERVVRMVERGMVDEVREFYAPNGDYSRGIRRAIGVPEFDQFFRVGHTCDEFKRGRILSEAIEQIKANTSSLALKQLKKIRGLKSRRGWRVHRLDATEVFKKCNKEAAQDAWEELVAGPGANLVRNFLYDTEEEPVDYGDLLGMGVRGRAAQPMVAVAR